MWFHVQSKWTQVIPGESKWIQMSPSHSKWVPRNSSESKGVQVSPNEIKWIQMKTYESKWVQVNSDDPKRAQVSPGASKWAQVNPSESKWVQVNPDESKWVQVKPNESKGIQMTLMTSLQRGLHKRERARQQVRSQTKEGILHIGNSIRQHHNANACTKCARKKIVVLPLFHWKMLKDIVKDVHTSHTKAWKTQISILK